MPLKFLPEPWKSFLTEIDDALEQNVDLHCLGGFAGKVLYDFDRETSDVDILPVDSNSEIDSALSLGLKGSKLHKKYKINLEIVGVAPVPYDYEQRLIEIYPGTFKHLGLFGLDPYDLALTKIERNSQRDRDDVKHLARVVPFDLEVLRKRFEVELRSRTWVIPTGRRGRCSYGLRQLKKSGPVLVDEGFTGEENHNPVPRILLFAKRSIGKLRPLRWLRQ